MSGDHTAAAASRGLCQPLIAHVHVDPRDETNRKAADSCQADRGRSSLTQGTSLFTAASVKDRAIIIIVDD